MLCLNTGKPEAKWLAVNDVKRVTENTKLMKNFYFLHKYIVSHKSNI